MISYNICGDFACSMKVKFLKNSVIGKLVEKVTGKKLKGICTDNGGEFTSSEFKAHLHV